VAKAAPLGVEGRLLVRQLEQESDTSVRRALILALGEYGAKQLPSDVRDPLTARLLEWYQNDPDPGIHGAIDWLLRHRVEGPDLRKLDWGQEAALQKIDEELKGRPMENTGRRWYVNCQGHTMVRFSPDTFRVGSPAQESGRNRNEEIRTRRFGRSFALAAKPVTFEQWQRFLKDHPKIGPALADYATPEPGGPMVSVSWYQAAAYCRWLSDQERLPEEQMCYPKVDEIEACMNGLKSLWLPFDYISRGGYRLPTEDEWEYACRARAESGRYYGNGQELLSRYAWFLQNAEARAWPVDEKRPNDFGLFGMHGSVWNWCQDSNYAKPVFWDDLCVDVDDELLVNIATKRWLRGGSMSDPPVYARSACRVQRSPEIRLTRNGLRVARTLP
jgi:formylglycine-generating enzyme required for sulfatase activity